MSTDGMGYAYIGTTLTEIVKVTLSTRTLASLVLYKLHSL